MNLDHFYTYWTYCKVIVIYIYKKCKLTICNNCVYKDKSFTMYI